jgi:hypothetical protein
MLLPGVQDVDLRALEYPPMADTYDTLREWLKLRRCAVGSRASYV